MRLSILSNRLACFGILACTLFATSNAAAAVLNCRANVALNRVYEVTLDTDSGAVTVGNDAGTNITGTANRYQSGRTGDVAWFLATGFNDGVEIQQEAGGARRVAMCLASNECYLCR